MKSKLFLAAGITLSLSAFAQTNSQSLTVEPMNTTPTFRVTVISRNAKAINYQHRSGSSKLDFAGTMIGARLTAARALPVIAEMRINLLGTILIVILILILILILVLQLPRWSQSRECGVTPLPAAPD